MRQPLINVRKRLQSDIEALDAGYTINDLDLYATQEAIEEANELMYSISEFKYKVHSAKEDSIQSKSDTKVAIKNEHLAGVPFTLKTRIGLAIVFGLFGDCEEVGEFMQKASHTTRSYYVNSNRLNGFLKPYSIVYDLRRANLMEVAKHQQISQVDMQTLLRSLEGL